MKIKIILTLTFLSICDNLYKVNANPTDYEEDEVTTEISYELEDENRSISNCTLNDDCGDVEARKKKRPGSQIIVVESSHEDHNDGVEFYSEDEGIDDGKRKGRKKKKGRKKDKHSKIHFKKVKPYLYAMAGMKMLLYHLLLKKFAFFSMASFFLSKISFILASLVALKQFFNTPTHHRSSDSNKVEVVHIPIRKEKKSTKYHDDIWDESRFIPITFAPPDTVFETTPSPFTNNFNFGNNNQEFFNDSNEDVDDSNTSDNNNFNEVFPQNHKPSPYKSYQSFTADKKLYPNRVNAAFL